MDSALVLKKHLAITNGKRPRVLDLFGGCGGLSLGFHAAGCEIVGGVEQDPLAAESHARNFFSHLSPESRAHHAKARDITKTDPRDLMLEFKPGCTPENEVDIIVGGPPCQAFARVGRAKLREIAEHPTAFRKDPRAGLYLHYLEFVQELQPVALLMENVPDILNFGGRNLAEEICEVLSDLGYDSTYTLLNSVYYGVPQMRERMFLVAHARTVGANFRFPTPTNWYELPKGYESSRNVALQAHQANVSAAKKTHYVSPPAAESSLPAAVTAKAALSDLPPITGHLEGKIKRGARRFDSLIPYPSRAPIGAYAKLMRGWPGFENTEGIKDHVIRSLPRDYPIFRRMKPGDQYPQAYAAAVAMFEARLKSLSRKGKVVAKNSAEYRRLKSAIVPPYDPGKFPNKWRKMEADAPSRTLLAHIGKDTYTHIHYDSDQARTISVREAARLQSFPDGFVFAGTMNPAFRQIGNAVPPVLVKPIAAAIIDAISKPSGKICPEKSRSRNLALQT